MIPVSVGVRFILALVLLGRLGLGEEISAESWVERVTTIADSLEQAGIESGSDRELADHPGLADARRAAEELVETTVVDGSARAGAQGEWLVDQLDEHPTRKRVLQLAERLREMRTTVDVDRELEPASDAGLAARDDQLDAQIARKVAEIGSRSGYEPLPEREPGSEMPKRHPRRPPPVTGEARGEERDDVEAPREAVDEPADWGWLDRLFSGAPSISPAFAKMLMTILAVVIVALAVAALIHNFAWKRRAKPTPVATHDEAEVVRTRDPDELAAGAGSLARAGRHREAIRMLYLELLARLHRAGAIRFDRTRTNWEYGFDLRPRPELLAPFESFTTIFDLVWYGLHPAGADEFDRARAAVRAIAEHLPESV